MAEPNRQDQSLRRNNYEGRGKMAKTEKESVMEMGKKEEGAEATQFMGKWSRGYRGKAEGVASIVPHNGGFVQSGGGWDQGPVSVGAGREAWSTECFPGKWGHLLGQ